MAPERLDFKPYAYGFQKNAPLLGIFNYYIRHIREKGTLKKIINKHEPEDQV